MKQVVGIFSAPNPHWVGDGFPVRTLFTYQNMARHVSPFLLLDHAGPSQFLPAQQPRGVGKHPHRGFETVTIVYEGELQHRDSTGSGGLIGPGDVQWMTAGAGILHEEFHSESFTKAGGTLEMVQLWVNLPKREKMTAPAYQTILDAAIPVVPLPNRAGKLRLIAGAFGERNGPARTFTEMDVWDIRLLAGKSVTLPIQQGRSAAVVMLRGTALLGENDIVRDGQWGLVAPAGSDIKIEANVDSTILVLSGDPIEEPIVGHGPFVMNTQDEITQAFHDLQSGQFGRIEVPSADAFADAT